MRLLFLHTDFRVYWLPRLAALATSLVSRGDELVVVEISGVGSPYAFSDARGIGGGCTWQCLFPDKRMEELPAGEIRRAVFQALDELHPDIVFAGALAYPSGASGVMWCRTHHVPLVIFDNARLQNVPRSWLTNYVKRKLYESVDGLLIPAPSHVWDYEYWGVPREKMSFGLNVVDNAFWQEKALGEYPTEVPLLEEFFLVVGRQLPRKNLQALLEGYGQSGVKNPLMVVGNGPEHEALERQAASIGLSGAVYWVDFLPPEKLGPLYARAKALLLPSIDETWGLTVNEAMACGTPVIVNRLCGCCETLCLEGKTGFCCDSTSESISLAIRKMAELSDIRYEEMRAQVRELISQWGAGRFVSGVTELSGRLVQQDVSAGGFRSLLGFLFAAAWRGRFRPA